MNQSFETPQGLDGLQKSESAREELRAKGLA